MRSYLIFFLALIGVLLFDWWGQSELETIAQQGVDMTLQQKALVKAGQWDEAADALEDMQLFLEERDLLLSTLVEHDRIDILRSQLTELESLLYYHEGTLALVALDRLQLAYVDLYDSIRVSWENVI